MSGTPRVCAHLAFAAFDEAIRHSKAMPDFASEFLTAGQTLMAFAENNGVDERTCELLRGAWRRALAALGIPERPLAPSDFELEDPTARRRT